MRTERQISPITIFSPVRRWWTWWLWASWLVADRSALVKGKLWDLGFIHIAHWALVLRRPASAADRPGKRLKPPYVLFQSNYDGGAAEYAETFALEVPGHIRGMWGGAYDFPGPHPPSEFVYYVIDQAIKAPEHYYSAYPRGTVRSVRAALELEPRFQAFFNQTTGMGEMEFAAAWQRFLTREQRNL
jgi:hypothetical protein